MSFTLALILIVALDIAILAALAFVMTRPAKLTPHAGTASPRPPRQRIARARARSREEHAGAPMRPALD